MAIRRSKKDAVEEQGASAVDHPAHYNTGDIEVIDAIEDWGLGFNLGNAVKYVARSGHKSPDTEIQDLKKAIWYIQREIGNKEKL